VNSYLFSESLDASITRISHAARTNIGTVKSDHYPPKWQRDGCPIWIESHYYWPSFCCHAARIFKLIEKGEAHGWRGNTTDKRGDFRHGSA
jgi:hypothetical protein